MKRWASWRLLRLCSVLFGDLAGHFMNYFFYDPAKQTELHQRAPRQFLVHSFVLSMRRFPVQVRRDYPERGDSACAFFDQTEPLEGLLAPWRNHPPGNPDNGSDVSCSFSFLRCVVRKGSQISLW